MDKFIEERLIYQLIINSRLGRKTLEEFKLYKKEGDKKW